MCAHKQKYMSVHMSMCMAPFLCASSAVRLTALNFFSWMQLSFSSNRVYRRGFSGGPKHFSDGLRMHGRGGPNRAEPPK